MTTGRRFASRALWVGIVAGTLLAWAVGSISRRLEAQATSARARSQQTATEIQADVLVDALLDEMQTQLIEEGRLRARILAEPGRHVRMGESRNILREWARRELETYFERQVAAIHRGINRGQPAEVIRLDWLRSRAEARRPGRTEAAKAQALQGFETVFASARREVVAQQWLDLEPRVARLDPGAAEIERIAAGGRRGLVPLRQRLDAQLRAAGNSPWRTPEGSWALFEENQARIGQALEERIGRGLAELEGQREILARGEVQGVLAETLARNLRRQLDQRAQQLRGGGFGLFPSVVRAIPRRSAELMTEHLANALGPAAVCAMLTPDKMERRIIANLARHVDPARSFEILRHELPQAVRGDLIRHTLEQFGEAAGNASRLAGIFQEKRWQGQLASSVEQCLSGSLPLLRAGLARRQVARQFPNLPATVLPEAKLLEYRKSPYRPPAELIHAVGASLTKVSEPLLHEAQAEAGAQARRLLEEGTAALDQQEGFANDLQGMIDSLRQAAKPRDEILQRAGSALLTRWSGERLRGNSGARKYPMLFRYTKEHLEDLVDNAMKASVKAAVVSAAKPSGGGGGGKGGGQGRGTGTGDGSGSGGGGAGGECPEPPKFLVPRERDWRWEALAGVIGCLAAFGLGRWSRHP